MKKYDVIVVGGGIGGSSCSFYCKQAGLNVLMVEKEQFPRDKVCGDGIQAPMLEIFKDMGIYDEVLSICFKDYGGVYSDADERKLVVNFKPPYSHLSAPRYVYDAIVNRAAVNSGIDYMDNFEALELLKRRGQVCGVRGLYRGKIVDIESKLVVLASGSHSMLAREAGFYEENPDLVFYGVRGYFDGVEGLGSYHEFHYPEIFRDGGYIWLFPQHQYEDGTHRCNVGVFVTEANLKDIGMTSEEILWWWKENTKIGKERLGNANLVGQIKGWRLPCGKAQKIAAPGVVAVGDSGNMIDQCFGGGAGAAMRSGKKAAQFAAMAVEANDFSMEFMQKYEDMIEEELGGFYRGIQAWRDYIFKDGETTRALVDYAMTEGEVTEKGVEVGNGIFSRFLKYRGVELKDTPYAGGK